MALAGMYVDLGLRLSVLRQAGALDAKNADVCSDTWSLCAEGQEDGWGYDCWNCRVSVLELGGVISAADEKKF